MVYSAHGCALAELDLALFLAFHVVKNYFLLSGKFLSEIICAIFHLNCNIR